MSPLYQQWDYAYIIAGLMVPVCTAIVWLRTRNLDGLYSRILILKEVVATRFMRFILAEAKWLIGQVGERLPHTLTRLTKDHDGESRFNVFIRKLRELDDSDDGDDSHDTIRDKLREIVGIYMVDTIIVKAQETIDSLGSNWESVGSLHGSQLGVEYALRPDTQNQMVFVSEKIAEIQRREKKHRFWSSIAVKAFCVAVIAAIPSIVSIFFRGLIFGGIGYISGGIFALTAVFGLIAVARSIWAEEWFESRGSSLEECESRLLHEYELWLARNKT